MDALDRDILALLIGNGRMTVKEIARRVSLTSPAVAERMRKMEKRGVIAGYTVRLAPEETHGHINAIISIYVAPTDRSEFLQLLHSETSIAVCYQVTGQQSHMVKVSCPDIAALDRLINNLQKLGPTNTQIVLSTVHGPSYIPGG